MFRVLLGQTSYTVPLEKLNRSLLAVETDGSEHLAMLTMGCRSIFTIEGDQLIPREQKMEPVTAEMKSQYKNSLRAFETALSRADL